MQANSWHINYSTCICHFVSGKCGKERKKLQKFEYLENEKNFLDEIKNTFHGFWRAMFWWKNKTLIKKQRTQPLTFLVLLFCKKEDMKYAK